MIGPIPRALGAEVYERSLVKCTRRSEYHDCPAVLPQGTYTIDDYSHSVFKKGARMRSCDLLILITH